MFKISYDKKITMVQGDTGIIRMRIHNYELSQGDEVRFAIVNKANPSILLCQHSDKKIVLEKKVTVFEKDGSARIILYPYDTEYLQPGKYLYEIQVKTKDGRIDTVVPLTSFTMMDGSIQGEYGQTTPSKPEPTPSEIELRFKRLENEIIPELGSRITNVENEIDSVSSSLDNKVNKEYLCEVNVKDFNALGKDEDYTSNIQNAIDYVSSIGGGYVYLPRGIYKISTPLYIPKNVHIKGDGRSTLLHKISGNCIFHINKNGSTSRTTIKGNIIEKLQLSGYSSRSEEGGAIKIEQAHYTILRDLQIIHFNGNGVEFYGQCDYSSLENVDISLCSVSPTGRLLKDDTTPNEQNIGYTGYNGRCAIINFNINNNERPNPSSTTTADLYLYKCTLKDNDCGIRWNGADLHAISTSIQCNSLLDVYSESAMNFTECHFEHHTEKFIEDNNIKSPLNIILKTNSTINFSNCNFWGNDAINSKYIVKAIDTTYNINFNNCKVVGFANLIKCNATDVNKLIVNGLDVGLGSQNHKQFNIISDDSEETPRKSFINYDNILISGEIDIRNGVFKGHLKTSDSNTWNIGESNNRFNNAYLNNVHAKNTVFIQEKGIYRNSSSPEGVIVADVGSLCLTHQGLYVKESGFGNNTGWVKK